jgi:Peptidase C10 family/Spi protease inhibitor/Secretion system C-terminal sorting domain
MLYLKTCSKRAILLISFIVFVTANGFGKSRTSVDALRIVDTFCQKGKGSVAKRASGKAPITRLVYTCSEKVTTRSSDVIAYYYIFNIGDENGFVIVSGDDRAKDILGYSENGSFQRENMPENFRYWMKFYEKELKALSAISEDTAITTPTRLPYATTLQTAGANPYASFINPLLAAIQWDQSKPYNILCPILDSIQTPTGCVATAMAQVMKYHQWPVKGTNKKTYKSEKVNDSLTVDFSMTTYDWANMKNKYNGFNSSPIQDTAIATLMYHCGVAVNMEYEKYASSAFSNDIPAALINYFGYDKNAQLYSRDYFSETEWINLLKTELNASRPVLYGGSDTDGSGNQFICDGYDSDNLFHFNWGWSGSYNGYFELSSLNCLNPGIGGGTGGFSIGQDMVIGIQKPTETSVKTYQLFLLNAIKVNQDSIARDSTFNLSYGYANYGGNTFDGAIALGLYQGDSLVSIMNNDTANIPSYYGETDYKANSLSFPLSVTEGIYQLYSIFKGNDQSNWSVMRYKTGTPYSLIVTVKPTTVTFTTPDLYPKLALTESIKVKGKLYKGKTARLSAIIQNTGGEFNSYLIFKITSTEDENTYQYLSIEPINIPAGTTKTIEFSGKITLNPGEYVLNLLYDFKNDQSNYALDLLTPVANNSINVAVSNAPELASKLSLTEKISLADSILVRGSNATLKCKVKNSGGYFNNYLLGYIFKSTENISIDNIGPVKVILDTNEEKEVTFNKDLMLEEGSYILALYYFDDSISGGRASFTPDAYSKTSFTVINPTDLEKNTIEKPSIYPNAATGSFSVQSSSLIKSILILDISGKQISKIMPLTAGTVSVNSSHLSNGVYLIKIETEKGNYTEKFFKSKN